MLKPAFAFTTAVFLALLLSGCAPVGRSAKGPCSAVTEQTCTIAADLGRGINLGNMLEAPREGDWGLKVEPVYLDLATGAFDTVRLPVRWTNHAAPTADATLNENFARRVDAIVDTLLARGVYVILNVHHYSQATGSTPHNHEFSVDPAVVDERLVNIWRQLALRYRDRSPKLLFELLNEPHGRLDGDPWNVLAEQTLRVVRESNPTRAVLIGPGYWNNPRHLAKLRLPPDRNLIVAIHTYDPFPFTHQGLEHTKHRYPSGPTCCNEAQRRQIVEPLELAYQWSRDHGYPLHLGEFGASEAADLASREAYARLVRDEAEKRGIGWAYWELAWHFGVYSPVEGAWIEPMRRALLD
jgi:endoglucanase